MYILFVYIRGILRIYPRRNTYGRCHPKISNYLYIFFLFWSEKTLGILFVTTKTTTTNRKIKFIGCILCNGYKRVEVKPECFDRSFRLISSERKVKRFLVTFSREKLKKTNKWIFFRYSH